MRTTLLVALLCGAAAPALAQDAASGVREASAKFTAALAGADAATAGSLLTDDAVALPPGRPPINGKAQIQRFFGGMTHAVKNLKYTAEAATPLDDGAAREVGTFSFKLQNNDVTGKYLLVWTKVGSDWKVSADMWNRDASGGSKGGRGGRRGANGGNGGNGGNGMNGADGMNGANGADE